MERSEAAKKAGSKDVNFSVAPGRSGMYAERPYPSKPDQNDMFRIPG